MVKKKRKVYEFLERGVVIVKLTESITIDRVDDIEYLSYQDFYEKYIKRKLKARKGKLCAERKLR